MIAVNDTLSVSEISWEKRGENIDFLASVACICDSLKM